MYFKKRFWFFVFFLIKSKFKKRFLHFFDGKIFVD
jgi:hypothetical protein